MASTKNVQALNTRLDVACRSRVQEFYRQHVSSLAHLKHQTLDTARLLKSIRKCPSDHDPLSIKFLGPAPKSSQYRRGRQQPAAHDPTGSAQTQRSDRPKSRSQSARLSPSPAKPAADAATSDEAVQFRRQQTANPIAFVPKDVVALERAKTFAVDAGGAAKGDGGKEAAKAVNGKSGRPSERRKMERFYSNLEETKRGCGLPVIDATQTPEAHQFYLTLSRAEWRLRLAKIDPEYFKNAHLDEDFTAGASFTDMEKGV